MADKEKKKKKKKEEAAAPPPEPEPAPAPEPEPAPTPKASTKASSRGSKKSAKRSGSNVFSMFSQGQIAEFKEGFAFMDADKDGIINKSDLRSTFNQIGKLVSEKELDEMVNEAPGPINFTQMLTLFANRMSGQADEDEVVIAAFKTFDQEGVIDGERLKHALTSWGEKFTEKEVDQCYENFEIDENMMIDTEDLLDLIVGAHEEGEEETLRYALMTWGEKFSGRECDDAWESMSVDDKGMIDTNALIEMLCGAAKEDEEAEE